MADLNRGDGTTVAAFGSSVALGRDSVALARDLDCSLELQPPELPSFFVVGPPRTGTSWLHEVLQKHTNLPGPTKETRFFDCHFHRGLKWYQNHFPVRQPGRLTGEIAPTYFASPEARGRILQTVPNAKLIFIFRNPLHRVVSLYRVKRAYGLVPWNLEEALERDPELLASGRYATFLKQWQDDFAREQTLITVYDDLRNSPQAYMDTLLEFLGLPSFPLTAADLAKVHSSERMTEPRHFVVTWTASTIASWCKARSLDNVVAAVRNSQLMKLFLGGGSPFPEVSPEAMRTISKVFVPELEKLEKMIGRDLSHWKQMLPDS